MGKYETGENQSRRKSRAGIAVLIILLLLAGAAGYLYYSVVKAPLDLDDPQKLAASAPMEAEERFAVSADGTVQIRMDKGDIWSLILAHGGNDFLNTVNQELSRFSLSVSGCGLHMDGEGLRLDLELFCRGVRLVAKVPCSLEVSGQHVSLKPTGVKLGAVSLPVGKLLSSLNLEYDLALPVISEVAQLRYGDNEIVLTGPLEPDIRALIPQEKKLYRTAVFSETLQSATDMLKSEDGFGALLSHLEGNPEDLELLYRDLFVLAEQDTVSAYLDNRYGMTERFFPGIDFSAAAEENSGLNEQLTTLSNGLEQFFNRLVGDYNDKKFRLSKGEFLKNGKPFQADKYGAGEFDSLFETLDPESFFLILVDAEDGYIRSTSSFYRICDEKQEFTQSVDFNKTYILGCVFRGVDGEAFLMYETEISMENSYSRSIKLVALTEEEVAALQVSGKFGVWTD